jgi:hypothetical protein
VKSWVGHLRGGESEIASEVAGHGLPLSKSEAYNRVYDNPTNRVEIITRFADSAGRRPRMFEWSRRLSSRAARARHRLKETTAAAAVAHQGRFPMKTIAEVIGVSRSNVIERLQERPKTRTVGHRCRTTSSWPRSRQSSESNQHSATGGSMPS